MWPSLLATPHSLQRVTVQSVAYLQILSFQHQRLRFTSFFYYSIRQQIQGQWVVVNIHGRSSWLNAETLERAPTPFFAGL